MKNRGFVFGRSKTEERFTGKRKFVIIGTKCARYQEKGDKFMLEGKTIVIGVTGSIAAYKMANVVSMLKKKKSDVHVIMTQNATNFIHPTVFETLTGNKCMINTFDRDFKFEVTHISIAKKADIMFIAPASANVIGKLANGIADDMLTTTALACTCKKIIAPAMNTNMFHNEIVQDNLKKLKNYGFIVIEPAKGILACKDMGDGKLPEESLLVSYIEREIAQEKDMAGLKVLVSAGPTQEKLDPVRYISNHSTGKMGIELARAAMERGAEVTLVLGKTSLKPSPFVKTIPIVSAEDMFQAVKECYIKQDIIIKAAAVADYRPSFVSDEKIKKKEGEMSIPLERTTDILKFLGENRRKGQYLCGFSMETQNMIENSRAKLEKKKIDMIVANNLKEKGAGFSTDTNIVTLITKETEKRLEIMPKEKVANCILDEILKRRMDLE